MTDDVQPPRDLTAIIAVGALDPAAVRSLVAAHARAHGIGDVLVRVAPLGALGLTQIEVHGADDGLPREDPELVAAVSKLSPSGRAAFVHANHSASQAIIHPFASGQPGEGFAGQPGADFDARIQAAVGASSLGQIVEADDGSRYGIGVSSSRTVALVRGVELLVPPGLPTDLQAFQFHDLGRGLDDGGERLAFVAFDRERTLRRWREESGRVLATLLEQAPVGWFGPLLGRIREASTTLAALGERTPEAAGLRDVGVLELLMMHDARAFSIGDTVAHWSERVLPVFCLAPIEPRIDPEEVEDLDEAEGILHALVEVMPATAPPGGEGAMLDLIADDEIVPIAPWVAAGEEVAGALFELKPARLHGLLRAMDGRRLHEIVERFARAWYRAARPGQPEGDAYVQWRRAKEEEGLRDTDRFFRDATELRALLEIAAANRLAVGLLFYEGGEAEA
jgi:hypothetical protein